ncbi:hypothetical protein ACFFRR_006096 [Megaselia abdita]
MKSFIVVALLSFALAVSGDASKQPTKGIIGNVVNGVTGTVGGVVGGVVEGATEGVGGVVGGVVEGVGGVVEGVGGIVGGIGGQEDQGSLLSQIVKALLKVMEQLVIVLFNLVKIVLACVRFLLRSLEQGKLLSAIGTVQTILNTLNTALRPILNLVNALLG